MKHKMLAGMAGMLLLTIAAQPAAALPTDAALFSGLGESLANWTRMSSSNDQLWSRSSLHAATFKLREARFTHTLHRANSTGGGKSAAILSSTDAIGTTASFDPGFDPFTFLLDSSSGPDWYSRTSLNSDGDDHLISFRYNGNSATEQTYLLFWEDLPDLGDEDFRDMVVSVRFAVPEPATLAVFGFGLVGLGFLRRRRSA